MAAFFARRLVGGLVELLLLSFLFYALLVPSFVSNWGYTSCDLGCDHDVQLHHVKVVTLMYAFDKPWPVNYATWLFHPSGTNVTFRGGSYLRNITLVDSGVLIGDFGYSLNVERGAPVLQLLDLDGLGLPLLLGVPFGIVFFFMLVVVLQRRGRPVVYGLAVADNPARVVWRRAELWPSG